MLTKAVQQTFDATYPDTKFRKIHASIEYPIDKAKYPGIWIDYEDVGQLEVAGVDHKEYIEVGGVYKEITRWRFSGFASFTVTALTSRERDALYDEMIKTIAFGRQDPLRGRFRDFIESNPFIAATVDWDQVQPRGNVAAPGTPWGTDEIIYERTINLEIIGEFVPTPDQSGELLPLSRIILTPNMVLPGETDPTPVIPVEGGASDWH